MAWFEHGNSRIYFEETGAGVPVLFLPGLTDSIERYSELRQVLAAAGYRVIAADLPGSGRSEPQPRAYTRDYYQKDAHTFAALLKHLAAAPAHLIGFSDGGETSLLIAIQSPGSARSLIVWGAAGALDDPEGQLVNTFATLIDNPIPRMAPFRDYLVSVYGEANARSTTQSVAGAFREIVAGGGNISQSRAGEIKCPSLVIAGAHDPFFTRELVAALADKIPDARLEYLEDVGHDVYGERQEWLTQMILNWLATH